MDWLSYAVREGSYIVGLIVAVVFFTFYSLIQPARIRPLRGLAGCAIVWMYGAYLIIRSWPPTMVQLELLGGITLASFLFGFLLSRLVSINVDMDTGDLVAERSVTGNVLSALLVGVLVALLPRFQSGFEHGAFFFALGAGATGTALGIWQQAARVRVVRYEKAGRTRYAAEASSSGATGSGPKPD